MSNRNYTMTLPAIKAALNSKELVKRLRVAIHNTSKKGYSCSHVRNRNGRNFLAVRVRDNELQITTRTGQDVTQLVVLASKQAIASK